MTRSNPYQILGVHPTADEEEIKQAYRRLAKEFHPDLNPGDHHSAERFREINLAFGILRDPKKRATFDQWGLWRTGTQNAGASSDKGGEAFTSLFEEIFGDLVRGKPQGTPVKAERGRDLKHHMTITLEQAAAGATVPIRTDRLETCEDCRGRGAAPDARTQPCVVCGGLGYLQKQRGLRATQSACKSCGGTGQILFDVCGACGGNGGIRKERTLNVRIPPGAEEGFTLKVSREGDAGTLGGAAGDLLISLGIQPHDVFRREGRNLHISIPITITDAALGAEVDVPTLNGPVRIKIPAGTQSGKAFSLQGKGLPRPGGGAKGDVIVHIHVETPTRMSQKQRKLLEEFNRLQEIGGDGSSGKSKRRGWRRLAGVSYLLHQWLPRFHEKPI